MKKKDLSNAMHQRVWIYLFILPTMIIFLTFMLVPLLTVAYTSFTKWDGFDPPRWIGVKNYITLFNRSAFTAALSNLIKWALIAGTMHVGFGVLIALIIYHRPFGWRVLQTVFMVPNVISIAVWAMIYKFFFNVNFGVLNTVIRIFVPEFKVNWLYSSPYAFWSIVFMWVFYAVIVTLVVLGDLMAIPTSLHEAAVIDGAKPLTKLLKIDLPLCRRSIGTSVILAMTGRIGMYANILLTTQGGPGNDTMNIPLIMVSAITNEQYGLANATAVFMIFLGLIILFSVNKLFRMDEAVY